MEGHAVEDHASEKLKAVRVEIQKQEALKAFDNTTRKLPASMSHFEMEIQCSYHSQWVLRMLNDRAPGLENFSFATKEWNHQMPHLKLFPALVAKFKMAEINAEECEG